MGDGILVSLEDEVSEGALKMKRRSVGGVRSEDSGGEDKELGKKGRDELRENVVFSLLVRVPV